jgi:hypothetical protein
VDDAAFVRVGERVGNVAQRAAGFVHRQGAVVVHAFREIVARDVRHHEEDDVFQLVDGVDVDDVRMVELRRGFRFAQKARLDFASERELGGQDLDGDHALEAAIPGPVNDPHAPTPDLAVQLVVRIEHALDMRAQLRIR